MVMSDTDEHDEDQLNFEAEASEDGGAADRSDTNDIDELMDDPELEAIKARVKVMEEESEKLRQLQSEVDKQLATSASPSIFHLPQLVDGEDGRG